jgi:hypothetical protein
VGELALADVARSSAVTTACRSRTRSAGRALLAFGQCGDQLVMVSVVDGEFRLRRLADPAALVAAVRLVEQVGDRHTAADFGAELEELLHLSDVDHHGDREWLVLPDGVLHALPWGALPTCAGRPVTVIPSLAGWRSRQHRPPAAGEPVWISGPGLVGAEREVRRLARAHGGRLLVNARVDQALAALAGARVAHLAAHGEFRAGVPLLSGVRLGDGTLYGYDLAHLPTAPELVVLAACDTGLATVRGGEPSGLVSAFLQAGAGTVIAGVLPIPDAAAVPLMTALHAGLARGLSPAAALAHAQAAHGNLGLVCFG